tara:strand:- start:316 stop:630 length:315 start_codon:yes stop_codon:yes gene_type:complete
MADFKKPSDPNWIATFSMKRNPDKQEKPGMTEAEKTALKKRPDLVLVDSDKVNPKSGKNYRKNFTINSVWCEASCYIQENKDLKITIKKTGGDKPADDGFANQF